MVSKSFSRVLGMAGHKADQELPGTAFTRLKKIGEVDILLQIPCRRSSHSGPGGVMSLYPAAASSFTSAECPPAGGALPAPDVGDDAVGAEIVAAVHDGYPGLDAVLPHHGDPLSDGASSGRRWKTPRRWGAADLVEVIREFCHRA